MKLSLFLIVLCCYLALSSARTIPDKKDSENDADPYLYPPPPPPLYPPYLYPPPPPAPIPPHDLPHEPEIPHPIPEFPGTPGDETDEVPDEIPAHVLKQLEEEYLETLNRVNHVINHAPVVAPAYPTPADDQMEGLNGADYIDEGLQPY